MRPLIQALPGALTELLREMPISDGKVQFAWGAAVGNTLGRITWIRLEGTRLIVEAQSAAWAREIRRSSGMILARLQTLLGSTVVTRLEVRTPRHR
jgi:hypothetical protein